MCGGPLSHKPLRKIYGESIVRRTIRLLRKNGIKDIAISTNNQKYNRFKVPILHHDNPETYQGFHWLTAFYPEDKPVCYVCGDVFFSPEAIKTIVQTETDDIEFFASAPPFSEQYCKPWAEPFAFKVQDVKRFRECVRHTIEIEHEFRRPPISWELWQVIKGTPLNQIDYTNYTVINDYTVDIDNDTEADWITTHGFR